ncbi:hypothetical protein J3T98_11090 [Gilliamella sp. B2772]|uniref:hypothetical protein n=1 Tax=Gilliamella sp. B2772 TaxID=2817981 RepID=UPI00226AC81B|nr:hypothetical protein [Gilliamella sp. B2772]MCX8661502.1 hypothetical protein [Gilliamella sp. B2772]
MNNPRLTSRGIFYYFLELYSKFNNQLVLLNLNDNWAAYIKPYLFQQLAFNGQLWFGVGVGLCALWLIGLNRSLGCDAGTLSLVDFS